MNIPLRIHSLHAFHLTRLRNAQLTETESLTASEEIDTEPPPLRPLTSLKWPYVEEESAFPDPLKRDDPKPLQLHQYEAIATSPAIRDILSTNPNLRDVLRNIDQLRGEDRQDALQKALGVSVSDTKTPEIRIGSVGNVGSVRGANEDDVKALRRLAEAVEGVVRGGKEGTLGLDWGDS
ncbi:hypothetical protein QCA50_003797 [Cerrena zonata]|uniref:Uncharacterized protein n=1 Tax=Cerrena zonata TaxID=2478898 RepID=A0AAW0GRJ3_9APHY